MRYWQAGKTEGGFGPEGIKLVVGEFDYGNDRVVSLALSAEGNKVTIREECDGYFSATVTKAEAIEALREAIAWIERGGAKEPSPC